MRAIASYAIFVGLASVLSSCTSPYYVAQPAPVYYPLQGPGIYYPAQRAGIYYPAPRTDLYPDSESAPISEGLRERQTGEQSQAARRNDRHQSPTNDMGWIDPQP